MARAPRTITKAQLAGARERFVQAWGQMGPAWGISRTMAEVHALLYITGSPLNTDDVMDQLRISRGNASMSLRALVEWGLIERVHKRGDRKEYFQAEQDCWTMARIIIRERLRREILPTLASLYEIRDLTGTDIGTGEPGAAQATVDAIVPAELISEHNRRLDELLELVQTTDRLAERFVGSEGKGLRLAANLLSKII